MLDAIPPMHIELRSCTPDDEPFLQDVYATTRAEELALVPWNEEQRRAFVQMQFNAQHAHYRAHFPDAAYDVILLNGERAGRLYVLRDNEQMRILDITMLPAYRNAGIGGRLIQRLMTEAAKAGKPLRIYVESFNRSRGLFERLGFKKISEKDFNYLLEWRPSD